MSVGIRLGKMELLHDLLAWYALTMAGILLVLTKWGYRRDRAFRQPCRAFQLVGA